MPETALDPLDRTQRIARAVFAGGIVTLIAAVIREMYPPQIMSFAALGAISAWVMILSQTTLAQRFKLEPGPWRRILGAALVSIPALILGGGSGFFGSRAPDRAVLVYLLGLVLVDWSLRMNPRRDERISFGSAFAASLPALLISIFIDVGRSSIVGGLLLAGVSLAVNALSPFVPHALRKKKAALTREAPPSAPVDLQGVAATLEREAAALRAQHRRGEKAAAARAARPPWHLRPVHPLVRFLDYFLGATGIGVALVFLSLALFSGRSQLEAYTGAVVSGALGLFFFRRGLRTQRGKLWAETLRPFLLIGSAATLAICLPWIGYFTWHRDQPWNRDPLWALATVAVVVGVFSYVLRPWSRRRAEVPAEAAGPPERKVHIGWAALGSLLWMAGLTTALMACAATVGLPEALDLEKEIGVDERFIGFLPGAAWSLTLNLVIAASACVVVSRRQAGGGHLFRAVAGQAALGCLLLLAFQLASRVHVGSGGSVQFWGDEDGLFVGGLMMLGLVAGGVILLAWPLKRARPEPIPELSHA